MKIRLEGTQPEITAALDRLGVVLEVQEVSRFYPNRGASTLGRVYLTVAPPTGGPAVRAEAERTDQTPAAESRKEIRW